MIINIVKNFNLCSDFTKKMIKIINKNYVLIFLLTVILFLLKYFYTFFFFKEDFLITKILLETSDIQYYPLVESLSRFEFSPSFSKNYIAEKIITFPYLSIIWHAILFKFFGYYSFIILEFIFKFLVFIILYKIFQKLEINFIFVIFIGFLILILPNFLYLTNFLNFKNLYLINQLVDNNLGYRFPRPLVTFFYLNLFLYFLTCLVMDKKKKQINLLFLLSIFLIFLAHSFFYLFISCLLLLITICIIKFKKNFFIFVKKNILIFFKSFLVIIIGLFLLFLQNFYGELDHSNRIGLFKINLQEKIFLFKFFFSSFLRIEIIIFFIFIFTLKFFTIKIFVKRNIIEILNIFFYLFICSVFSPFIFVFLSSKIISLYHFFDLIIFFGIYYIFLNFIIYFFYKLENLLIKYKLIYFLFLISFLSVFLANRLAIIQIEQRKDINLINNFLLKNNIQNTNKILFTNDLKIINLWLHHKNKYLSVPEGFSNSLTDDQIKQSLFTLLKSLNIQEGKFIEFLNLKLKDGRSFYSTFYFAYKYQANSLKLFSNISNYLPAERIKIINTSPLRASANIIPQNEKLNIISEYQNFKKNIKQFPDIIIIDKRLFINFNSSKYIKILDTDDFSIYLRN